MSVLIITTSISGKSGIEKSVISTANLLSRNGMDVSIATISNAAYNGRVFTYPTAFELDDNVKRFSLKEYPLYTTNVFEKKNKIVLNVEHEFYRTTFTEYDVEVVRDIDSKLSEDDIVIFSASMAAELFSIAKIKPRYKTVMQLHSDYEEDHSNREHLVNALDVIDVIQPVAEGMVPYIADLTGFSRERIIPIYNVLNFSDTKPKLKRIDSDKFRISIVGSLQERKNQLDALKVMKYLPDNYVLQIYGGKAGDYYIQMLNYISQYDLGDKVEFMGYRSETEIYSETDLLIITAKSEGFGYTLLEAAYYGIPAVTYDYRYGANEVIKDSINGYLIEFDELEDFANKIKIIKEDVNVYKKFAKEIQNTFFEKFSASKIYEAYSDLLGDQSGDKNFENDFINEDIKNFDVTYQSTKLRENQLVFEIPNYVTIENQTLYAIIFDKKIKLKYKIIDNKVHTSYFTRYKFPFTYIVLEDNEGYQTYLFNINSKGAVEKIKIYTMRENPDKVNLLKRNSRLNISWLENPRNKSLVDLLDDSDNPISYTIEKKSVEGYYTEVIKYDSIQDNLTLVYNDYNIKVNIPPRDELDYKFIFDKLCDLEQKENLFDFTIDGIYIWEIIRPNLIIRIMQDNQMFKYNFGGANELNFTVIPNKFESNGNQLLCNATNDIELYKNIVDETFDIQVSGTSDYIELSKEFGEQVEFIDQFRTDGFEITETDKIEDLINLLTSQQYDIDEDYLRKDISNRLLMYKSQYRYYNKLFNERNYYKIYIVSSVWTPGIVQAAKDNDLTTYEVQYALATKYHLNYGINKNLRKYKTDIFLTWSDFWASKNLFCDNQESISEKMKIDVLKDLSGFDVAFVSQHLLSHYSVKYINNLAEKYPDKKIAYLAHPKEIVPASLLTDNPNVKVFVGYTEEAILLIDVVIGMFSTVLYDAATLGKAVYVIDVPGSVIVEEPFFNKLKFDEYTIDFK